MIVQDGVKGARLDAAGNRLAMDTLDGAFEYQYDPLHRLTEATYPDRPVPSVTSYAYDDNGNQTGRPDGPGGGGDTFAYDHEDRLTAAAIGGAASSSTYNGDGLRMSHSENGVTTGYTWDVAAGLPVVLQDSDGSTYVYGLDLISVTDDGGDEEYYLYDGLGSTTGLTDGEGEVTEAYTYDAFGAVRAQSGSSANPWLFAGEQQDGTGLQYLRARYYDPQIGRFLSRDPLPLLNRYAYVRNNPLNYTDPRGLFSHPDLTPDFVDDAVDEVEGFAGDAYDEGEKLVTETVPKAASDAGEWLSHPQNAATVVQLVSGAIIVTTCPWGVTAPICLGAITVYIGATTVRVAYADSQHEALVLLASAPFGAIPGTSIFIRVPALFIGQALDALSSPHTAESPGKESPFRDPPWPLVSLGY